MANIMQICGESVMVMQVEMLKQIVQSQELDIKYFKKQTPKKVHLRRIILEEPKK